MERYRLIRACVGLLAKGLQDDDIIDELYATLESLPSGLQALYQRMFDSLPLKHRVEAARIFRLERLWRNLFKELIPALILCFALRGSTKVASAPSALISTKIATATVSRHDMRIRSRCVGLLEIVLARSQPTEVPAGHEHHCVKPFLAHYLSKDRIDSAFIRYHHQTVADFLCQSDILELICDTTQDPTIDPHRCLASACISMLKSLTTDRDRLIFRCYLLQLKRILRFSRHLSTKMLTGYTEGDDTATVLSRASEWERDDAGDGKAARIDQSSST